MKLLPLIVVALLGTASAVRTTVPGTTLSVDVPSGFAPMDAATIATKYPRGIPPRAVYTTPDTQVNVAFQYNENAKAAADLKAFGDMFARQIVSQMPGQKLSKQGLKKIAGRQWYELEFTINGADQPIYNHMLVSSEKGHPLIITVNATTQKLPAYKTKLDGVIQSLK